MGGIAWTPEDIETLRRLHPDCRAIDQALPHRTPAAIRKKAQLLGLTREIHLWTGAEIARLRRIYPTGTREQVLEAFPGWSYHYLQVVAWKHGIGRVRRPHRPTDDPILNQILLRSRALGWNMPRLDREVDAGGYFRNGGFRTYQDAAKINRAIEVLSGTMQVTWEDA